MSGGYFPFTFVKQDVLQGFEVDFMNAVAAETGDTEHSVLELGREKLARKGCDLLVVNAVGDGKAFEVDDNAGWLLTADGAEAALERASKTNMASRIADAIVALLGRDGA